VTASGPLDKVIAADIVGNLGAAVARNYGRLPYLLKFLSIEQPLSIQVHPTLERARSGFAAEEDAGIATTDPGRIYKDASHKPEMLVAVSDMTVLSGFRPEAELMSDLERLGGLDAESLRDALEEGGLAGYVLTVLTRDHTDTLDRLAQGLPGGSITAQIAVDALAHHVRDKGALVALAMNAVALKPGDAIFTPAGTVHCYIRGDGVEIMANSDNVVRAGLTHKPINADLLCELAVLSPGAPAVPVETLIGSARRLSTDATEFELVVVSDGAFDAEPGPRIVLAIDADARVRTERDAAILGRGHALFVAADEGHLHVETSGVVVVASVPVPRG
jgi:mannose-6-phosphate isomerase